MPSIGGEKSDRVADAMEELCEKLEESIVTRTEPPVVHVAAPTINVEAKAPAPTVNVAASTPKPSHPWTMTVHRNGEGLIETITIVPN